MSTWIKLDDNMPDNPKILNAGPAAAWLYICGLAYASRNLTDGFIPSGIIRRLSDLDDHKAATSSLVDALLWHKVEGGYQIHDYADHQRTSEQIETQREQNRKRVRKHRERVTRYGSVSNADVTQPETETESETENKRSSAAAPPSAKELSESLTELVGDLMSSTFAGDPVGGFLCALEAADALASDHPTASPNIRGFLRNHVLSAAAVEFHDLAGKNITRQLREAKALGADGHRWLITALATSASSDINGDPTSYVIKTARNLAAKGGL